MDDELYTYNIPEAVNDKPAVAFLSVLESLASHTRAAAREAENAFSLPGAPPTSVGGVGTFLLAHQQAAARRRDDAAELLRTLQVEVQAEMVRSLRLSVATTTTRAGVACAATEARLVRLRTSACEERAEAADAIVRDLQRLRLVSAADHAQYLQRTLDAALRRRL